MIADPQKSLRLHLSDAEIPILDPLCCCPDLDDTNPRRRHDFGPLDGEVSQ